MLKKLLLLIAILPILHSCGENYSRLPDVAVDEWVYLDIPSNINLQSPGGWVYINGGIRGIIVYNVNGSKFKAYERSCPHLSPNACTTSNVENDIIVICPCDQSRFLLATGEPLDGAPNALKEYTVFVYDSELHIVN